MLLIVHPHDLFLFLVGLADHAGELTCHNPARNFLFSCDGDMLVVGKDNLYEAAFHRADTDYSIEHTV